MFFTVEPEGPFIYGSKTGDDDVSKVDVVIGQENELICQAMKGKPKVVLQWFKSKLNQYNFISVTCRTFYLDLLNLIKIFKVNSLLIPC